jgi:hypothetical protein
MRAMFMTRIASLFLSAALVPGCTKPQVNATVFYGTLAVALPPLLAYKKIDDALALGPEPRQATFHPLTSARLASWAVKDEALDIAWQGTERLAVLTKTSLELWEDRAKPRIEVSFPINGGHVLRMDPAAHVIFNWDTVGHLTSWQTFDGSGPVDRTDLAASCGNAQFADDGAGFVCGGTYEIAFYPIGSPTPEWGFTRLPEEPQTCSPQHPCHTLALAATGATIASAQVKAGFSDDASVGSISLHSRIGETRTLTPAIVGRMIMQLGFSPSGKLLMITVMRGARYETHIIDTVEGKELIAIPNALRGSSVFKVSRDDRFICGPTDDHSLLLIDLETRKSEEFATGHKYNFAACAFSPDGTRLAMAVSSFQGTNPIAVYTLNTH